MSPLRVLLSPARQVDGEIPIYIGKMDGREVIVVRSGVGQKRTLKAAEFIHSIYRPHGVLSTGFCGGLVAELRPADVVLSSWLVSDAPECLWDPKRLLLGSQASRLQSALKERGIRAHVGGFACVSQPAVTPTQKSALAHRTGAMIADMETFHLGAFFLTRKVPFMGVRTVVDCLEDRIPLWDPSMETGAWPGLLNILRYLISHGGGLPLVWRLYQNGRMAQGSLGKSVATVVRVWP